MLKIKDNVELKELEKFGFKKLDILDDEKIIAKGVYCLIDNDDKEFIRNNAIDDFFVQYYFNNNKYKKYCTYPEQRSQLLIERTDFNLIKADLVEEVDD